MSEIKFRAWDKNNKEMHYDFEYLSSGNEGNDWIVFRSDRQKLSSLPHPFENPWFKKQFEIMQFTGLHDKNEKKIYEGDVIKLTGIDITGSRTTEVVFDNGSFREKYMGYNLDCYKDYEIEVIGNIYENPELLEKETP